MTAQKYGFYCKSFKADFDHLAEMLNSFGKHNPEQLPLTLSLPAADVQPFKDRFGSNIPNVRIVSDEDYCQFNLARIPGWYAQQLCKLTSWRATGADHYAILDSDSYFIRDVRAADLTPKSGKEFMVWGSALRTVMGETDNDTLFRYIRGDFSPKDDLFPPVRPAPIVDFAELKSCKGKSTEDLSLELRSGLIYKLFQAKSWYYYQPGQIFSTDLLIHFEHFITENNLNLAEAIALAPWEYNWYGEYAAAMHSAETDFRVSPVFHFPNKKCVDVAIERNLTEKLLAQKFIWVQMAARHLDLLKF